MPPRESRNSSRVGRSGDDDITITPGTNPSNPISFPEFVIPTEPPQTNPTRETDNNTVTMYDIYSLVQDLRTEVETLQQNIRENTQEIKNLKEKVLGDKPVKQEESVPGPSSRPDKGKNRETTRATTATPLAMSKITKPPAKYDGKEKGAKAKEWITLMAGYINMVGAEFPSTKTEMVWFLSQFEGLASSWAQPHREKILKNDFTGPTTNMDSLRDSFLATFGDPNAAWAAHRKITDLKQGTVSQPKVGWSKVGGGRRKGRQGWRRERWRR